MEQKTHLYHFGVKGMKWGQRKSKQNTESYSFKTKSGEKLTLQRYKTPKITKAISRISPSVKKNVEKTHHYALKNDKGKTVGDWQMYRKSKDEMNITWGSVNKKYQGRGYMSAMIKQGEKIAKQKGASKMTGEVVGNSPDMLHIATKKQGYIVKGQIKTQDVLDTWGGLTLIEKKLK